MIRYLTGTLAFTFSDSVVLDVAGVGYEVFVASRTQRSLTLGSPAAFHIYTVVKEDSLSLYGFSSADERKVFALLTSVSGVGPKTALSVLEKSVDEVVAAIQQSQVAFFSSVPRLGKKTAQKIIVELQSKLGKGKEIDLAPESSLQSDVRGALVNFGYPQSQIELVLADLEAGLSFESALKWSLQQLSKRKEI